MVTTSGENVLAVASENFVYSRDVGGFRKGQMAKELFAQYKIIDLDTCQIIDPGYRKYDGLWNEQLAYSVQIGQPHHSSSLFHGIVQDVKVYYLLGGVREEDANSNLVINKLEALDISSRPWKKVCKLETMHNKQINP